MNLSRVHIQNGKIASNHIMLLKFTDLSNYQPIEGAKLPVNFHVHRFRNLTNTPQVNAQNGWPTDI